MGGISGDSAVAQFWGIRLIAAIFGIWLVSLTLGFEVGLVSLTVVGFTAAVVGLTRPILGVLGVVILCTLDAVSRILLLTGGLLRWNTFNYFLIVVMLLHAGWVVRWKGLEIRLLQAFTVLLIMEVAISEDLVGGVQEVLNVLSSFGVLICLARARSSRDVWYWSAMTSNVLAGLGSFVFYLQAGALPEVNANAWSFFPLTALFSTCVCFASPGGARRARLLVGLAFVNAAWVFLSGSRGSVLICATCLCFILIRLWSERAWGFSVAASMAGAILIAAQFRGQEDRAAFRLTKLFDPGRSLTDRTSGRSDLALGGLQIFLDHPLGVGTGGFPRAWAAHSRARRIAVFTGAEKQAHSGWIKVLVENGIPGILLFGGFVLSFAFVGWRRRRAGMFLPGLVVTLILSVSFLVDEFQGKGLWYLTSAVILFARVAPAPGGLGRSSRRAAPLRGAAGVPKIS
jgi:O-antigen ligase